MRGLARPPHRIQQGDRTRHAIGEPTRIAEVVDIRRDGLVNPKEEDGGVDRNGEMAWTHKRLSVG